MVDANSDDIDNNALMKPKMPDFIIKAIADQADSFNKRPSVIKRTIQEYYDVDIDEKDDTARWNRAKIKSNGHYASQRKQKQHKEIFHDIKEKPDAPADLKKKAVQELTKKDLILNILIEIRTEGLIGNEDSVLTVVSKVVVDKVKDVEPTSKTLVLAGLPDGGKDAVASKTLSVMKPSYEYSNDLSEKFIGYWTEKDWKDEVFYIEDPDETVMQGGHFKAWITGKGKFMTLDANKKPLTLSINGQPVIIITSFKDEVTLEGDRRIDYKQIEDTEEIKEAFKEQWRLKQAGLTKKAEQNKALRYELQNCLMKYEVLIPNFYFIKDKLLKNLVKGNSNVKRCFDYIKSITILHQYQRKKDKEGRLIATFFDVLMGFFLYYGTRGTIGKSLSIFELKLVKYLSDKKWPVDLTTLEKDLGLAYNTARNKMQNWLDKELCVSVVTEKECGSCVKDVLGVQIHPNLLRNDVLILSDFNTILNDIIRIEKSGENNSVIMNDINDFNKIVTDIDGERKKYNLCSVLSLKSLKSLESLRDEIKIVLESDKIEDTDFGKIGNFEM